jgi:hypothetical protein
MKHDLVLQPRIAPDNVIRKLVWLAREGGPS